MTIASAAGVTFEIEVPIAIVGAGACGLIAALAAHEAGVDALLSFMADFEARHG